MCFVVISITFITSQASALVSLSCIFPDLMKERPALTASSNIPHQQSWLLDTYCICSWWIDHSYWFLSATLKDEMLGVCMSSSLAEIVFDDGCGICCAVSDRRDHLLCRHGQESRGALHQDDGQQLQRPALLYGWCRLHFLISLEVDAALRVALKEWRAVAPNASW